MSKDTPANAGSSLYKKEPKVYPREVSGKYARLRKLAVIVLLGMFYFGPWLQWRGRQAVLFDLPARKFYIFDLTLWPQDFLYLALLLIILALCLFFFTAIAGRIWCGFACPQTVWTEAFVWIEQLCEGNRNKRIKLDKAPWSANKLLRKSTKQFLWIALALYTGFAFVAYFTPARELLDKSLSMSLGGWESFWILFYGFATYGNAGYMREQVCKYMCPYARFQSSMFDKDTLIITYDADRGEPRGGRRRSDSPAKQGLGDCIDCTLCVQVCPTGIDIRDGLQYECIACAACIDACDEVMDKMMYPKGLIRYSTEHAITGKTTRILRPRVAVYAGLLLVLIAGFVTLVASKQPVILDVMRDRNALYRDAGRQGIENNYALHLINKSRTERRYLLSVSGVQGIRLNKASPISVAAESMIRIPVAVTVPHEYAQGAHSIEFTVSAIDDPAVSLTEESRFRGPNEDL